MKLISKHTKILIVSISTIFLASGIWSAIDFDGSDDYVDCGNGSSLDFDSSTQDFSIFAWIKRGATGNYMSIVQKGDANNDFYRLKMWNDDTVMASVDAIDVQSSSTITDTTTWHHVGVTIDRDGNGQVYIDGSADGSAVAINNEAMSITNNLEIGRWGPGDTYYYDGLLDDIRIYNRVLSAQEIAILAKSSMSYVGGALDRTSNWTAVDSSSNTNNGTLTNSPERASASECVYNHCLDFDGSDDYLDLTNASILLPKADEGRTYSMWVKNPDSSVLLWQFNTGSASAPYLELEADNEVKIYFAGYNYMKFPSSAGDLLTDGNWHLLTFYIDGTEQADINNAWLYIDSSSQTANKTYDTDAPGTMNTVYIGSNYDSETPDMHVDDIRIYKIELSSTQIDDLYNKVEISTDNRVGYWKLDDCGPGLVGYWPMDDTEDGVPVAVYDSSSNTNHGNMVNFDSPADSYTSAVSTMIGYGSALEFDGSDDYVTWAESSEFRSDYVTVSLWFKHSAGSWQDTDLLIAYGNRNNLYDWQLRTETTGGNVLRAAIRDISGSGNKYADTADAFSVNTWHHAVFTFGGSDIRMYADGQLSGTPTSVSGTISHTTGAPGYFGRRDSGLYFPGLLDDIRIYNVALSSSDVSDLYNGVSLSTEPVAHWSFDRAAQIVRDRSGKDNHGEGENEPTWKGSSVLSYP